MTLSRTGAQPSWKTRRSCFVRGRATISSTRSAQTRLAGTSDRRSAVRRHPMIPMCRCSRSSTATRKRSWAVSGAVRVRDRRRSATSCARMPGDMGLQQGRFSSRRSGFLDPAATQTLCSARIPPTSGRRRSLFVADFRRPEQSTNTRCSKTELAQRCDSSKQQPGCSSSVGRSECNLVAAF